MSRLFSLNDACFLFLSLSFRCYLVEGVLGAMLRTKILSDYARLLEPLTVGKHTLRNRVVMGSIHSGLEEVPDSTERMSKFYGTRAKGEVGLIVTGGVAPNRVGKVYPMAAKLTTVAEAKKLKPVTDAVHSEGGKILLQILHAGRYAYSPLAVAPSSISSPIWMFDPAKPIGMPNWWVQRTINDFGKCCALAREAGFDGVEIMGSEGYLINQFIVSHTNARTDQWGGSFQNRCRFPLEIVKACRKAGGPDFMLMYRLSMLDLVPNGSTREEVYELAEAVCNAGVDIINTGIGWHEARIPTIATSVPRASFTWVTKKCRDHLRSKGHNVPLVTTNRINTPAIAEEILREGDADLVSMARPLLADADFVSKTRAGNASKINVCIGCNQACLDHTFSMKIASCLVNPVACHETTLTPTPTTAPKNVCVVGAGPAGCAFAICAAERGHNVTIFERNRVGGQFNVAKKIPGKAEFQSSIDYWQEQIKTSPRIKLIEGEAHLSQLQDKTFDHVVVATGCGPRSPRKFLAGCENNPQVMSYLDVILGRKTPGRRVAVIGAGGIGFDVSVFLTHATPPENRFEAFREFAKEWGVDTSLTSRGFVTKAEPRKSDREVFMFQRKKGKVGSKLGATTGWIHRLALRHHNVKQFAGVEYKSFENGELVYIIDGETKKIDVDSIVLCHGQESIKELSFQRAAGTLHYIGGCKDPSELDAKKAILDGHSLALKL